MFVCVRSRRLTGLENVCVVTVTGVGSVWLKFSCAVPVRQTILKLRDGQCFQFIRSLLTKVSH